MPSILNRFLLSMDAYHEMSFRLRSCAKGSSCLKGLGVDLSPESPGPLPSLLFNDPNTDDANWTGPSSPIMHITDRSRVITPDGRSPFLSRFQRNQSLCVRSFAGT
jgi:hypothetical protein